jgi:DNA-binding response OmpR family regulator
MTHPPSGPEDKSAGGSPAAGSLHGVRIILVEDEFLLAKSLEEDLRSEAASVVGVYAGLAPATLASRQQDFDVAILDVNLAAEMVYPLADELAGRRKPFVLLTGYGASNLPERFRHKPRVTKPYDIFQLIAAIRAARAG